MKRARKLIALILALTMTLAMGLTAFASDAETTTSNRGEITIKNATAGATYKAYKIFDLTLAEGNSSYAYSISSNSEWLEYVALYALGYSDYELYESEYESGSSSYSYNKDLGSEDNGLTLTLSADGSCYIVSVSDEFSAANFAEYLASVVEDSGIACTNEGTCGSDSDSVVISNLPLGYYLVIRVATGEYSDSVLLAELTSTNSTVEIYDKNVTEFSKTVYEEDGETVACDVEIGDVLIYKIETEVPDWTGFEVYTLEIDDSWDDSLTLGELSDFKIVVDGYYYNNEGNWKEGGDLTLVINPNQKTRENVEYYEIYRENCDDDGNMIYKGVVYGYIVLSDKDDDGDYDSYKIYLFVYDQGESETPFYFMVGSSISILYKMTVNEDGESGSYRNSASAEFNGVTLGSDNAEVYNAKIIIYKYNGDNVSGFVEESEDGSYKEVCYWTGYIWYDKNEDGKVDSSEVEDGGMLEGAEFVLFKYVEIEYDEDGKWTFYYKDNDEYYEVGDDYNEEYAYVRVYYVRVNEGLLETDEGEYYEEDDYGILDELDDDGSEDPDEFYEIDNGSGNIVAWTYDIDVAYVVETGVDGTASFVGLENGTYYLLETAAPDGYNLLTSPVKVTVNAGEDTEEGSGTYGEIVRTSLLSAIANYSGLILPSTGGTGTTVLYVVGAVLVLGAGIVLIAKRRMGA